MVHRWGAVLLGATLLFGVGAPVQAQRLALPPAEQAAVDRAIDGGVAFLKKTQLKSGTWALPKARHHVGYSALPGLTLLECDVPPSDPIVQRTAKFVRAYGRQLDTTYELSLAILFLDRLGDPKDKKLIQTFALRLIAGQSATGGWGYKCPVPSAATQMDLLIALRHIDPPIGGGPIAVGNPAGMPGIAGGPGNLPGIARRPGDQPGIAEGPGKKPGGLAPVARAPGGGGPRGTTASEAKSPLSGTTTGGSLGSSLYPQESISNPPSLWRAWLGFSTVPDKKGPPAQPGRNPDGQPPNVNPKGAKPADAKPGDAKAGDAKPADVNAVPPKKPYVIPERLQRLPVIQDPARHLLLDPTNKSRDLIVTTTDNSNTQFAILALWTAQRYDVPMNRSLNLVVRRYVTSQNANGTWGYHYRFGGAAQHESFSSPGAMTCVGLIGLAVGHGLANQGPGGKVVQDPRILGGLAALSGMIGQPAGRMANLPMQNLYALWSIERVAVLYNLPMIGDKDWYRWGAEILVANQQFLGNWANGQYPSNSPTIDTCLALLFLKRANLVKDLAARLPFNPDDLNKAVLDKLTPPSALPKTTEPIGKTTEVKPVKAAATPEEAPSAKPSDALSGTMATRGSQLDAATADTGGGKKKWIVLSILVFLLATGGGLFLFLVVAQRKKNNEDDKEKLKGPKGKRRLKSQV